MSGLKSNLLFLHDSKTSSFSINKKLRLIHLQKVFKKFNSVLVKYSDGKKYRLFAFNKLSDF